MTDLLKPFQWFIVPHGFHANNAPRYCVRVFPRIEGADGKRLSHFANGGEALCDWPAYLARGKLELEISGRKGRLPFYELWRAHLHSHGLTVEQASQLWRCIFQPSTPIGKKADRFNRAAPVLANAYSHARLAASASQVLGRVIAQSFVDRASDKRRHDGRIVTDIAGIVGLPPQATAPYVGQIDRIYRTSTDNSVTDIGPARGGSYERSNLPENSLRTWARTLLAPGNLARTSSGYFPSRTGGKDDVVKPGSLASVLSAKSIKALALDPRADGDAQRDPAARFVQDYREKALHTAEDPEAPKPASDGWREFHALVGSLIQHPWLLQVLGLVVENEGVPSEFGHVAAPPWGVAVVRVFAGGQVVQPKNLLATLVDPGTWRPVAPCKRLDPGGCVDLGAYEDGNPVFQLSQFDVDSGSEKLVQAVQAYRNRVEAGAAPDDRVIEPGPQRTAGISLSERRTDRVHQNREDLATRPQIAIPGGEFATPVYAEDLFAGYRPDVAACPTPLATAEVAQACDPRLACWAPLVARELERVELDGRDISDWFKRYHGRHEGFVGHAVRRVQNGNAPDPVDLAFEEVFAWHNWNLAVPRPECQMRQHCGDGPKLTVRYRAAAGLAPQRLGWGYRFGMRVMYLDGNSLGLAEAVDYYDRETSPLSLGYYSTQNEDRRVMDGFTPFLRYEPIAAPDVHLTRPLSRTVKGERTNRLVVSTARNSALTQERTSRHVIPPRVTLEQAIRHGEFDQPGRRTFPPRGAFDGYCLKADGSVPTSDGAFACRVLGQPFDSSSRGHGDGQTMLMERKGGASPDVPYLPDPWARNLVIGVYEVPDQKLLYLDYFDHYRERTWPDCRVLKIEAIRAATTPDGRGLVEARWKGDTLELHLSPAASVHVRFWYEMDAAKLASSGVLYEIADAIAANHLDAEMICKALGLSELCGQNPTLIVEQLVAALSDWDKRSNWNLRVAMPADRRGKLLNLTCFWMLNPHADLELLHAVEQPVVAPMLSQGPRPASDARTAPAGIHPAKDERAFCLQRNYAETVALIAGDVRFHRRSTAQLSAEIAWIDNLQNAGNAPTTSPSGKLRADALPLQVHSLFTRRDLPVGDSNVERFESSAVCGPTQGNASGQCYREVNPLPEDEGVARDRTFDFKDARARVCEVVVTAASRHVLAFEGRDGVEPTLRSRPMKVVLPCCTRPDMPEVDYVIPLLSWKKEEGATSTRHVLEGGWFRIWLKGTWYSSGNGELLALVCWPPDTFDPLPRSALYSRLMPASMNAPPAAIEPYVTRWGLDPIWYQGNAFGSIPASAFMNRIRTFDQLPKPGPHAPLYMHVDWRHLGDVTSWSPRLDYSCLVEKKVNADQPRASYPDSKYLPNASVVLALYQPSWDDESRRWFVDIQMDPQVAYYPFVRLALARYQPHHMAGCEISRVVTSEFVQLMPTRTATLSTRPAKSGRAGIVLKHVDITVAGIALSNEGDIGEKDVADPAKTIRENKTTMRVVLEEQPDEEYLESEGESNGADKFVVEPSDRRDGAWVPARLHSGKTGELEMTYDKKRQVWTCSVEFEPLPSMRYSIFVTEHEPIVRDDPTRRSDAKCVAPDHRVVFMDRLAVHQ